MKTFLNQDKDLKVIERYNFMDNSEPSPTLQNLKNQYISLLKQNNLSNAEAEAVARIRFEKWKKLRQDNSDKLAWFMNTKNLSDENIFVYMISLINKEEKVEKISNFQNIR